MRFAVKMGAVTAICGCLLLSAGAQSIADAAKQKGNRKASRVITNDEIPPTQIEETKSGVTEDSPSIEGKQDDKQAAASAAPTRDLRQLNQQLSDLESNIADRQKRLAEQQESAAAETSDFRRATYDEVLAALQNEITKMNGEREKLKQQIEAERKKQRDTKKDKENTAEAKS
jgi:hypothetical protein